MRICELSSPMAQANKANPGRIQWCLAGVENHRVNTVPRRRHWQLSRQNNTVTMRIAPIQPVARRMYTSLTPSTIHEPAEKWRMLRDDLLSRRLPLTYDYLTPQPSHLLNLTLADLNPRFHTSDETLPSIERLRPLPIGHHSVYFPTQLPLSRLLPDGTDDLHSPGKPFTRRLWARGAVRWSPSAGLWLTGKRAVCLETIRDVTGKVHEKHPTIERIGIHLERRIGTVHEDETEESIRNRLFRENSEEFGDAAIIETRDILFLKTKSQESIDSEKWNPSAPKFIKRMYPSL